MTQAPETGAINRLHVLAPVSGTRVVQIWDQIVGDFYASFVVLWF